jgi:hypothetical protein
MTDAREQSSNPSRRAVIGAGGTLLEAHLLPGAFYYCSAGGGYWLKPDYGANGVYYEGVSAP